MTTDHSRKFIRTSSAEPSNTIRATIDPTIQAAIDHSQGHEPITTISIPGDEGRIEPTTAIQGKITDIEPAIIEEAPAAAGKAIGAIGA